MSLSWVALGGAPTNDCSGNINRPTSKRRVDILQLHTGLHAATRIAAARHFPVSLKAAGEGSAAIKET